MNCSLCNTEADLFFSNNLKNFYRCPECNAVLLHPSYYFSPEKERKRYENHCNDENDSQYQNFVKPIVNEILKDFTEINKGLDFGCGKSSAISKLLRDHQFSISLYDPYFVPNPSVLENSYDFIACCEVIEHFYQPLKEFKLLKKMLKPNGKLYCMTDIYKDDIDFENWYYKNDETHVIFYHKNTFDWIKKELHFSKVTIENRLIIFEN